MVSDGCEIYQAGHLVSYIMSNHWGMYLKLIYYCISPVIKKLKMILKKTYDKVTIIKTV